MNITAAHFLADSYEYIYDEDGRVKPDAVVVHNDGQVVLVLSDQGEGPVKLPDLAAAIADGMVSKLQRIEPEVRKFYAGAEYRLIP